MTTATKDQLERAIAALWNDLNDTVTSQIASVAYLQDDEWMRGFVAGVRSSRDHVGNAVRAFEIVLSINEEEK